MFLNGTPNSFNKAYPSSSVEAEVTNVISIPKILSTLSMSISGKIICSFIPNVKLPLEIMGYSKEEQLKRVKKVLDLVELTGFEKKYPWQLSGGMQQRASIARALSFDADILLMDEPFGALDEIVRDHLNEQLLNLWKSTNKTICFVTHSIPEAVYLSTKIVVMSPRPGRIVDIIESTLPSDRPLEIRDSKKFTEISQRVREGLRAGHILSLIHI